MAARKLCVVVHSPVKSCSCTLSSTHCHTKILCISRDFGTNLTTYAKVKYYFDVYSTTTLHLHQYKKRLLLRCIHHFKSDLINNMDHMRKSGSKPSSIKN